MKNLQSLTDQINSFDYFYEYSDDSRRYGPAKRIEKSINEELAALSIEDLHAIKKDLTKDMEHVLRYFKSFENLPEPREEKSHLSQIMTNAWFYMKKGIFATFSDCLKAAWKAYKMLSRLRTGIVGFTFRKATGQIREAKGTLNSDQFTFKGKGTRKEYGPDAIRYFDLAKDAWRTFRIERLISIAA